MAWLCNINGSGNGFGASFPSILPPQPSRLRHTARNKFGSIRSSPSHLFSARSLGGISFLGSWLRISRVGITILCTFIPAYTMSALGGVGLLRSVSTVWGMKISAHVLCRKADAITSVRFHNHDPNHGFPISKLATSSLLSYAIERGVDDQVQSSPEDPFFATSNVKYRLSTVEKITPTGR